MLTFQQATHTQTKANEKESAKQLTCLFSWMHDETQKKRRHEKTKLKLIQCMKHACFLHVYVLCSFCDNVNKKKLFEK